MLPQEFQETHAQLTELGVNLLQYLSEFRESRQDRDGKSLESVQADVKKALSALKESRYEVAVVAPMKAGKSTFLNSMIGADLLASESAACTICRTEVRHIEPDQTPRLLEYWDNQDKGEILVEGNAQAIQQKFLERTRQLRTNRENNPETPYPRRFELWHPIEAVQGLPALSGFTLIDTPGPNEWQAGTLSRETVALREAALAALRQCNVVIFVLNYRSVRDNAADELFKAITQDRKDLLQDNKARIYFILNQIDLRAEQDPTIEKTIDNLRADLSKFGFHNPEVYAASAFQGLLSKLIQSKTATESQVRDFRRFFGARFSVINEDGDEVIPAPHKICHAALEDSHIPEIQTKVFATIIQLAGWNLLCDVLKQFDKSAGAIEDTLNTEIAGWKQNIETLERRVKEYSQKAEIARKKLEVVKAKVDQQQEELAHGFGIAIDTFAEASKRQIQQEIEDVVAARQTDSERKRKARRRQKETGNVVINIVDDAGKTANLVLSALPVPSFVTRIVDAVSNLFVGGGRSLWEHIHDSLEDASGFLDGNSYLFKFSEKDQAEKFYKQISDFCVPHLQDWWTGVQDRLIKEGTQIREELAKTIRLDVQEISDELSSYLGEALEVDLNINPIQFPNFNFKGLDAQVAKCQRNYTNRGHKKVKHCFNLYESLEPFEETQQIYEIDLNRVLVQIHHQIDESSEMSQKTLKGVIKNQVQDDFQTAKKQLEDYINRFDQQLNCLLDDRQSQAERTPEKIAALEEAQASLKSLLTRLEQMQKALKCA